MRVLTPVSQTDGSRTANDATHSARPDDSPACRCRLAWFAGRDRFAVRLRENVVDDPAGNIGQAIAPAVVEIRQPLVIESEQVQDGGVQIVNV